jgi:outer membrane protein assembly factor BamB
MTVAVACLLVSCSGPTSITDLPTGEAVDLQDQDGLSFTVRQSCGAEHHSRLDALYAQTGQVAWSQPVPWQSYPQMVLVDGVAVIVVDRHALVGFDASTGSLRWAVSPVDTRTGGWGIRLVGNRVVLWAGANLYVVDPASGSVIWQTDTKLWPLWEPDGELVTDGALIFAATEQTVQAYDLATGALAWETAQESDKPWAAGYDEQTGSLAYRVWDVENRTATVRVLDAANGDVRWSWAVPDNRGAQAKVADGQLFITTHAIPADPDVEMIVFDLELFVELWRAPRPQPAALGRAELFGSLIIQRDRDGYIVLSSEDGTEIDRSDLRLSDVVATSDPDVAFAAGRGQFLAGIDESFEVMWEFPADYPRSAAVGRESIIFVHESPHTFNRWIVTALDLSTGAHRWSHDVDQVVMDAPPPLFDGLVLVLSADADAFCD